MVSVRERRPDARCGSCMRSGHALAARCLVLVASALFAAGGYFGSDDTVIDVSPRRRRRLGRAGRPRRGHVALAPA